MLISDRDRRALASSTSARDTTLLIRRFDSPDILTPRNLSTASRCTSAAICRTPCIGVAKLRGLAEDFNCVGLQKFGESCHRVMYGRQPPPRRYCDTSRKLDSRACTERASLIAPCLECSTALDLITFLCRLVLLWRRPDCVGALHRFWPR